MPDPSAFEEEFPPADQPTPSDLAAALRVVPDMTPEELASAVVTAGRYPLLAARSKDLLRRIKKYVRHPTDCPCDDCTVIRHMDGVLDTPDYERWPG